MAEASLLLASANDGALTAEQLAKHILAEIARTCGPQLPCHHQDSILNAFFGRFGEDAMLICDQAFGVHGGMWMGAPVTVLRFQAGHDGYFAIPLLEEARRRAPGKP